MNAPCKHCERKGCGADHDECEAYREYREKRERVYNRKSKERLYQDYRADGRQRAYKTLRSKGEL